MKKKVTALLLVFLLCMLCAPAQAFAEDGAAVQSLAEGPKIAEAKVLNLHNDHYLGAQTSSGYIMQTEADEPFTLKINGDKAKAFFTLQGKPFEVELDVIDYQHYEEDRTVGYFFQCTAMNGQPVEPDAWGYKPTYYLYACYNGVLKDTYDPFFCSSGSLHYSDNDGDYNFNMETILQEIQWTEDPWPEGPRLLSAHKTTADQHWLGITRNGENLQQTVTDELLNLYIDRNTAELTFSIDGKPFEARLNVLGYEHYEADSTVRYQFQFQTINGRPVGRDGIWESPVYHLYASYDGELIGYDPFFYSGGWLYYSDADGDYTFFIETVFDEFVWDDGGLYEIGTMFTGTGVSITGQYDLAFAGYLDLSLSYGENVLPLADIHRQTISIVAHNNNNGVNRAMQSSTIEEMTVYVSGGRARWVRILGRVQTTGGTLDRYDVTINL